MEFSKKIFFFVSVMNTIVVIFTMYMVWETKNVDPLRFLIPAVFTELATATGFYYNKAKAENLNKHKDNNNGRI